MNNFDYLLEKTKEEKIEKNVVGAVIVNRQGKILIMSRKSDDFMGGIDELPSGNMENGEDIPTALAREVKEETNCELNEILYYIDSFDYKSGSGKNARQYNFAIKVKETDNIVLTEHDSYSWQTVEEIINNPKITHEVKKTIKKYDEIKLEYEAMLEKFKIKPELIKYIEQIVNYHYNLNDKGHGVEHAEYVINRSMNFASQIENINYEMVYVIAAYHDVAHHIDAKKHETISAKMLREDKNLKEFFTDEKIKIMSEAVEDHRSSMETEPRSIYGKIVSSADRNTSVETTLLRCYSYNRRHFPELNENEIIEECRKFLLKKFGINGYARRKMYFDDKEYKKYLEDITELASNSENFREKIKRIKGFYMIIESKRIILRNWEDNDVEDLVEGLNNINVAKWMANVPFPYTENDARDFINRAKNEDQNVKIPLAIVLKENNKVIGGTEITNINKKDGTAGGGIWLNEKYQKNGYGTEAFSSRIKYCFEVLGLRRIENGYFPNNEKSRKMQLKLGYKDEGVRRNKFLCLATNEYVDECVTGLLKEEFVEDNQNK